MADLSKVLITGGSGSIGAYADFGVKVPREEMDITDIASVRAAFLKYAPGMILHLAGEADVDRSEREPERAYFVNSVGTYNLALAAREHGAKLIFVSTCGVFDGEKGEPYTSEEVPRPINHYGHSKYLGEIAVRSLVEDHLIVRTDSVFGGGPGKDKKLVAKTIAQLEAGATELRGISDQKNSPTYARDFIEGVKKLIQDDARGIRHVVNSGPASQYEIMQEVVRLRGANVAVRPVSAAEFKTEAPRWKNKSLAPDVPMRSWQEALADYLKSEWRKEI